MKKLMTLILCAALVAFVAAPIYAVDKPANDQKAASSTSHNSGVYPASKAAGSEEKASGSKKNYTCSKDCKCCKNGKCCKDCKCGKDGKCCKNCMCTKDKGKASGSEQKGSSKGKKEESKKNKTQK